VTTSPGTVDAAAAQSPPAAAGRQLLERLLLAALFSTLFLSLTSPAYDSDFWWHLASGRWMFEHRALLSADPFDFTSAIYGASGQVGYLLTQYWLSQVALYAGYLAGGLEGVALLRAAVFTALFFFLYRLLRRAGAGLLPATLLVAVAVQAVVRELDYIAARPQMWSSLLFFVLLFVLEHLRDGRRWAQFALPGLMLVWSNLHGGYVLGVVVIAIAAGVAVLSRREGSRRFLLVALAAVALTGCNPSGYEALLSYPLMRFKSLGAASGGIFEEDSLFVYRRLSSLPRSMPGLAAALLLPLLTLAPRYRSLLRERWDLLLLYLLTLGLGLKAARYLVFLVPMSCWVTALNLVALRERLAQSPRWSSLRARALPQPALAALTAVAVLVPSASYAVVAARSSVLRPGVVLRHPAEGAVEYLKRSGVRGNVFNEYVLGGYLAWRLHPEMKLFIYGRMVYPELLALYNDVEFSPTKSVSLTASGSVAYFYQKVLDENAVDTVIFPAADSQSGDMIPLVVTLTRDENWALVHAQPAALVFLRKTPALAPLVARALPPEAAYDAMIATALAVSRTRHGQAVPVWRRGLAIAYNLKGQKREALAAVDEYLRIVPGSTKAMEFRATLLKELAAERR
jgi:hypothetical protein